jgi:hypothetical protein
VFCRGVESTAPEAHICCCGYLGTATFRCLLPMLFFWPLISAHSPTGFCPRHYAEFSYVILCCPMLRAQPCQHTQSGRHGALFIGFFLLIEGTVICMKAHQICPCGYLVTDTF